MPFVKALGALVIRTTIGHTIAVEPNTPTYVPPEVLKFAFLQGCVQCTEEGELILQERAKKPKLPVGEVPQLGPKERDEPKLRAEAIRMAIAKLYTDGDPDDFTVANNHPKVKSVERVLGFQVTGSELQAALEHYNSDADD